MFEDKCKNDPHHLYPPAPQFRNRPHHIWCVATRFFCLLEWSQSIQNGFPQIVSLYDRPRPPPGTICRSALPFHVLCGLSLLDGPLLTQILLVVHSWNTDVHVSRNWLWKHLTSSYHASFTCSSQICPWTEDTRGSRLTKERRGSMSSQTRGRDDEREREPILGTMLAGCRDMGQGDTGRHCLCGQQCSGWWTELSWVTWHSRRKQIPGPRENEISNFHSSIK